MTFFKGIVHSCEVALGRIIIIQYVSLERHRQVSPIETGYIISSMELIYAGICIYRDRRVGNYLYMFCFRLPHISG